MNESIKTISFVSVAAVLAMAAVGSHFLNQPSNSADFELVGQLFYPEFESATQAQSLQVSAVDPESAVLKRFSVEKEDGLWRIPSHYNYPAEAAARLATTATSVMGISRDSLVGRLANEHERLGVVDPLSDDIEDPESVGERLTLKDADGEVVVDYIIGNEAGDVVLSEEERPFGNNADEKYYYVRRADEQQTYKVKLKIDLSTKFSDWIDPDLLRIDRNDITKITIDNYSLQEDRSNPLARSNALFKQQGDQIEVARISNTDAWELAGLNPETEELQTPRINEMLDVFDQMKIAGVRPKFKFKDHLLLTADLKLNEQPEFQQDPNGLARAINQLQNELDQKGFSLAGTQKKLELVAQNGDLHVGTDQGVVYTLHVGKSVEGSEEEIEIGAAATTGAGLETKPNGAATDSPDGSTDGSGGDSEKSDEASASDADSLDDAKNRYLMIRVSFDDSLIFPKPELPLEPVAPIAPAGYQPPPEVKPEDPLPAEQPEGSDAPEPPPSDQTPERNPEFVVHDEALAAYQDLKIEYELVKTRFENETVEFNKKVDQGQQLVDELNQRFGDWYYVITGDNLNTLQTTREDLVKQKELAQPPVESLLPSRPDISFPNLPENDPDKKEPPLPEAAAEAAEKLKSEAEAGSEEKVPSREPVPAQ